jgi:hypothetical protein
MTSAKQLYKEDKNLTTDIKWELEIIHNNVRYLVVWVVYVNLETDAFHGDLDVFVIDEDGAVPLLDEKTKTVITAAAKSLRWAEIQAEQENGDSIEAFFKPQLHLIEDLVEDIFKRSQTGEFVGQRAAYIYCQEVAKIIDYPENEVYEAAQNLTAEGKLNLLGNVLIPVQF